MENDSNHTSPLTLLADSLKKFKKCLRFFAVLARLPEKEVHCRHQTTRSNECCSNYVPVVLAALAAKPISSTNSTGQEASGVRIFFPGGVARSMVAIKEPARRYLHHWPPGLSSSWTK